MITPVSIRLSDPDAEIVRQSVDRSIREIQALALFGRIIADVELPNGIEVEIAHGLGKRPRFVVPSATRGAAATGRIGVLRGAHSGGTPINDDEVVCLQAVGFGATVIVDVLVIS